MLIEHIHKLFDKEERVKQRDKFYVSEANSCPVAVFFSFKNIPKEKLGSLCHLKFSHGNYTHNRLIAVLFALGIAKAAEIDIPDNELFTGRADAIVELNKELYVVEIKEVTKFMFEKHKPNVNHVMQLQLYLHYFNIDQGILLVENKETQELKEFIVNKDPYLIRNIINDFMKLKLQINDNREPKRPEDLPEWKCNYCAYAKVCEQKK